MNHHEKRLGKLAVDKGYITLEQLIEAMKSQVEENHKEGDHRLIGKILIEKGFIREDQIRDIIQTMVPSLF